jgi:phage terminase large subunit
MKTARDNKFVGESYLKNLEAMKEKNYKKYLIYAKNERGESID